MKSVCVALLGATSHIAKGLITSWAHHQERELLLYARSPERVWEFLSQLGRFRAEVLPIDAFGNGKCDVVVNCVGIGAPQKLQDNVEDIFRITTAFDDMILDYLATHPQTLYVNLSSGATYGTDFSKPVDEHSPAQFAVNNLKPEEFYGIAKLHAEAKHRALSRLNIVDLRIFGYFSRYIDLNEKFLLSEIITCLKSRRKLATTPVDIWRDYLHPQDLTSLIDACIVHRPLNNAYDAYSGKAASKFEILKFFAEAYGLEYEIDESVQSVAATGQKNYYYPIGRKAQQIGYVPAFTTIEGLKTETAAIFAGQ